MKKTLRFLFLMAMLCATVVVQGQTTLTVAEEDGMPVAWRPRSAPQHSHARTLAQASLCSRHCSIGWEKLLP